MQSTCIESHEKIAVITTLDNAGHTRGKNKNLVSNRNRRQWCLKLVRPWRADTESQTMREHTGTRERRNRYGMPTARRAAGLPNHDCEGMDRAEPIDITYFQDDTATPQESPLTAIMAMHGQRTRRAHSKMSLGMCVDKSMDEDLTSVPYRPKAIHPHTSAQRHVRHYHKSQAVRYPPKSGSSQ